MTEFILDALEYNPGTGVITWKRPRRVGHKVDQVAGTRTANGYLSIVVDGKRFLAHRLAWFLAFGTWPQQFIDHINGNKLDNRIANLREATQSQNVMNCGPSSANRSGVRGVCFLRREQAWEASITVRGKRTKLGTFKKLEDATAARRAAEMEKFGRFSRLASLDEKLAGYAAAAHRETMAG